MPRIIVKSGYMKTGGDASKYLKYIATRDGVQIANDSFGDKAATGKQKGLIESLLKDFPKSIKLSEYQDYSNNPIRKHASTLIECIFDEHLNELISRSGYLEYIANRPRVERLGVHGLFSDQDGSINLSKIAEEIEQHQGNVWTHIISLKREDAERLGYNHVKQWATLIRSHRNKLAEIMNIHPGNLKWYGAFHDEGHHPHIHLVVYSSDSQEGYLNKEGIDTLRSTLANDIFKYELVNLYKEQTQVRDQIKAETQKKIHTLIESMQDTFYYDQDLHQQLFELKQELNQSSGKIQYGYLKKDVKEKVDRIVSRLAEFPEIDQLYSIWKELRVSIHQTYTDKYQEVLPLHQQKEFRSLKNTLLKELLAVDLNLHKDELKNENTTLNEEPIVPNEISDVQLLDFELSKLEKHKDFKSISKLKTPLSSNQIEQFEASGKVDGTLLITRLLHHTSQALDLTIQQELNSYNLHVESKLRVKIKLKKQLLGYQWHDPS